MEMNKDDKKNLQYAVSAAEAQLAEAKSLLKKLNIQHPTIEMEVRVAQIIATNYAGHTAELAMGKLALHLVSR